MKLSGIKDLFFTPTANEIARTELADAQRELLSHQAQMEYHLKMAEFYQGVVNRLQSYVVEPSNG